MKTEKTQQKLKDEIEKLKKELHEELPQQISEARELGDLRENAGYHAARERMSFVKAKIAQLSQQLAKLNNIDIQTIPQDQVSYGSRVTLLDLETNNTLQLTFVSEGEMNLRDGKITLETPYGKALAGKKIGDYADVYTPAGIKKFRIQYLLTLHGKEFTLN